MKITLELTKTQEIALNQIYEALGGKETINEIASNMLNRGLLAFLMECRAKDIKKGDNVA